MGRPVRFVRALTIGAYRRRARGNTVLMPKTKNGRPVEDELPAPVARSDKHAQATFAETHDSALGVSGHEGDEGYAHRVAYGALKHTYEKVGDHWTPKTKK